MAKITDGATGPSHRRASTREMNDAPSDKTEEAGAKRKAPTARVTANELATDYSWYEVNTEADAKKFAGKTVVFKVDSSTDQLLGGVVDEITTSLVNGKESETREVFGHVSKEGFLDASDPRNPYHVLSILTRKDSSEENPTVNLVTDIIKNRGLKMRVTTPREVAFINKYKSKINPPPKELC